MVDQREYVNQETLDTDHLRVRFSFTLLAAVTVLAPRPSVRLRFLPPPKEAQGWTQRPWAHVRC